MNTKKNTMKVKDVIKQAEKLFNEREKFETKVLARTNEALYKILTKVYSLYIAASKNEKCLKDSVADMRKKLKERGIVTQKNTQILTVFVRFIFNSDRKRSYNYTQTLLSASDNKIKPENLSTFINENCGVEEIKRKRNITSKKQNEKDLKAKAVINAQSELESMTSIKSVKLPNSSVDLSDGTKYTFLIAREGANGKLDLLCTVPKTTKALENIAFKALADQSIKFDAENTVVVKKKAQDIVLEKATKSLTKVESLAA